MENYSKNFENENVLVIDTWKLSELKTLEKMIFSRYIEKNNFSKVITDDIIENFPSILLTSIVSMLPKTEKVQNALDKKTKNKEDYTSEIIEVLRFIKRKGYKVLIIDELDRVIPKDAIEIFRQINFLNKESNSEFPLLITCTNLSALQQSLKHVYGQSYPAAAFFDKTFDVIYRIDSSVYEKLSHLMHKSTLEKNFSERYFEGLPSLLRKMTYRKIELLAKDINDHKIFFTKTSKINKNLLNFAINILALQYIDYTDYLAIFNDQVPKEELQRLVKKYNLANENNVDEIYRNFKYLISDLNLINKKAGRNPDDIHYTRYRHELDAALKV